MHSADAMLVDVYRDLVSTLDELPDSPDKQVFEGSCGHLRSAGLCRGYARFARGLAELAGVDLPRCRVLEAGSGFGFLSVSLACLGAREVHGLEWSAGRLADVRRYLPRLPSGLPLQFHQGDVADLPFHDHSFDLVLAVEAVSHFAALDRFLAEARRVLAPGGVLLIADGNNGANRRIRASTERYWAQVETGDPSPDPHGPPRPPFVVARERMLQEELGLDPAEAQKLATLTSGLRHAEVIEAGRRFQATGEKPNRSYRYGTCPMDPVNDQYPEMLIDPTELGARLQRLGFRVRVLPHFGGEARGGWLLSLNRLLQRLPARWTAPVARGFRIVATKEAASG
jgi:SAM-dependent methyltransferase